MEKVMLGMGYEMVEEEASSRLVKIEVDEKKENLSSDSQTKNQSYHQTSTSFSARFIIDSEHDEHVATISDDFYCFSLS
jgi:hypothetical protein